MTDQEIALFRRLASDNQWIAFLAREEATVQTVLLRGEGITLTRAQGKAIFLAEIRKFMEASGKIS